jgi:TusE/DsrC/DsvC family sulfur relay protein
VSENKGAKLFEFDGIRTYVDDDGFLVHPAEWSRRMAAAMAAADGVVDLSDDHWKVMNYVREYWQAHDMAPMVRLLCRETDLTLKQIYDLFPSGPAHGACKYAGLPKPDGCV